MTDEIKLVYPFVSNILLLKENQYKKMKNN